MILWLVQTACEVTIIVALVVALVVGLIWLGGGL